MARRSGRPSFAEGGRRIVPSPRGPLPSRWAVGLPGLLLVLAFVLRFTLPRRDVIGWVTWLLLIGSLIAFVLGIIYVAWTTLRSSGLDALVWWLAGMAGLVYFYRAFVDDGQGSSAVVTFTLMWTLLLATGAVAIARRRRK